MVIVIVGHLDDHDPRHYSTTLRDPGVSLAYYHPYPPSLLTQIWAFTWFMMPMFTMLSGHATRPLTRERCIRLLLNLLAPYVLYTLVVNPLGEAVLRPILFEGGFSLGESVPFGSFGGQLSVSAVFADLLCPSTVAWYLLILLVLRLALSPLLAPLHPWLRVAVSVGLGVLAAYAPQYSEAAPWATCGQYNMGPLAVFRVCTLAPFFFLGQAIELEPLLHAVPQPPGGAATGWFAFLLLQSLYIAHPRAFDLVFATVSDYNHVFDNYRDLLRGCEAELPLLWVRYLGDLSLRLLCGILFLAFCVPRGPTFFTPHGARTMYPYLLQFPIVLPVVGPLVARTLTPWPWHPERPPDEVADFPGVPTGPGPENTLEFQGLTLTMLLWYAISLVLTWVLATKPAIFLSGWFVEPGAWLGGLGTALRGACSPEKDDARQAAP
jgi:hypothetical protein